ncbi:ABC transporter [Colletotrichum tofieldiae]|nr:ABC transporter [Colletotrichum tofieldiae]
MEKQPPGTASSEEGSDKVIEVKKRPEREPGFKDYIRVFSYATKWDIVIYIFASIASIGAGTTLPLMNIVFGSLAGQFTNYFMDPPRMTRHEFEVLLDQLSLYMLGLFLGRFVLNCINKFCFRMIGVRLSSAIRLHYIQSLFGQSVHVLDSMPPGSAASTITATANTLQIGISEKLGTFMEYNGTVWCAIVVAFVWSWKLTLVTFSIVIFILIVVSIFMPFIVRLQDQQAKSEAKANGVASESFSSIRMLTACGAQKSMSARYSQWIDDARAKGQRMAPLLALQFGLVFFGTYSVFGLSFWFGTKQFADGEMTNPGTTMVVLLSVMMIIMSVERIANPLMAVSRAMVAACEFFAVIDAPRPDTGHLREPDVVATNDIVFKNVVFAYPSRPHVKILDSLNLTIEAGKNTAIVGPSGSGKSTVVGLIERWYDLREQHIIEKTLGLEKINGTEENNPKKHDKKKNKEKKGRVIESDDNEESRAADESQPVVLLSGSITTGGKALTDIDLKWWRSQIGLVQQEPFLFNDTIFRNVAYGLIGSAYEDSSEEEKRQLVKEACHEAFADEFIDRLPDGYDTAVGDGGAKLSGGQRQRIAIARSIEYFESILFQNTAFFDDDENSHGTLVARVAGDPKQLEELLGLNMALLLMAVFNIAGALAIAYAFGWKLALIATFVTMPIGLFAGYWRFKYELEFEKMNAAVFAESSKFAAEAIGAFRTVSSLTMENIIHSRYDKLLQSHVYEAYKKARWTSVLFGFADSVNIGCQGLIFWYGGRLLASREYSLIDFFVCFMAVVQGAEAAGQGLSYGPNAAQASAAANRIISLRNTGRQNSHVTPEQIPDTEGGVKIELKNAHFRYPTRDIPVFTGIDLTINKGQFAALVGPSGCGKTSVISLLERFYSLDKGDILCNGKSIYSLDANQYRKNISLVAQEPCMFQGTIRENIFLGIDAETISDERLHQVCRDASIHDFIVSLPDGYNTDIGSKGFSLSGGQKQRISIARALIRDPKILLLDEATSSLDSESEKLVQAAFERASKGRTMICVAHRLATVQNADVIFVLGEGKVLEKGTHNELLKMQGVYWHMVSLTLRCTLYHAQTDPSLTSVKQCQSQALDR